MMKTDDINNDMNNVKYSSSKHQEGSYQPAESRQHSGHSPNHQEQIGGNQSLYYKKSQKISSRMFRDIFDY